MSHHDLEISRGRVHGPAWELVTLKVGDVDEHGHVINQYTPQWARIGHAKIADDLELISPKQSGHELEGHVRIRGKRYSAFTDGGTNPDGGRGMIIVRTKRRK